jgi:hypothetical protein
VANSRGKLLEEKLLMANSRGKLSGGKLLEGKLLVANSRGKLLEEKLSDA